MQPSFVAPVGRIFNRPCSHVPFFLAWLLQSEARPDDEPKAPKRILKLRNASARFASLRVYWRFTADSNDNRGDRI